MARLAGVSRQRAQQIMRRLGIRVRRPPARTRPCAVCGAPLGPETKRMHRRCMTVEVACLACGRRFRVPRSQVTAGRKYCSLECYRAQKASA